MYNHIGHLAEGQHALAKSLFLGGVTRRFPELRFAFLEGGVAWAAALYADLVGHWEKRNRDAMAHLDPAGIDRALLMELVAAHAPQGRARPCASAPSARRTEDPAMLDEFAACGIERGRGHRRPLRRAVLLRLRGRRPDDAHGASTPRLNPFGARLNAMFGSDIAHWDVPDMTEVLVRGVGDGRPRLIDDDDFRDFIFTNPVRFFTGANPDFFEGTVVAEAVRDLATPPAG